LAGIRNGCILWLPKNEREHEAPCSIDGKWGAPLIKGHQMVEETPESTSAFGLIERIKRNKVIVGIVAVATIATGIFGFITGADTAVGVFTKYLRPAPTVRLLQFAVSDPRFEETMAPILAIQDTDHLPPLDELIRTYDGAPSCEHGPPCHAVFQASIQNLNDHEIAVTTINYVVEDFGTVAGLGAGPLEPTAHYHWLLDWRKGTQSQTLVPPFSIPAKSAGAFTIELSPKEKGLGMAWLMHIEFVTHEGTVRTERFQFIP
jgi:hypothetical protein